MSDQSGGIELLGGPRDGELLDVLPTAKRLKLPVGFTVGAEYPFIWATYVDTGRVRLGRKVFEHERGNSSEF